MKMAKRVSSIMSAPLSRWLRLAFQKKSLCVAQAELNLAETEDEVQGIKAEVIKKKRGDRMVSATERSMKLLLSGNS